MPEFIVVLRQLYKVKMIVANQKAGITCKEIEDAERIRQNRCSKEEANQLLRLFSQRIFLYTKKKEEGKSDGMIDFLTEPMETSDIEPQRKHIIKKEAQGKPDPKAAPSKVCPSDTRQHPEQKTGIGCRKDRVVFHLVVLGEGTPESRKEQAADEK